MKITNIYMISFSPTGGTRTVVTAIAENLSRGLDLPYKEIPFTSKESRENPVYFSENDLVIIGCPVYAGRLPNKIMPDFKRCLVGGQAVAVPVVVFGNRSYGGALTELRLILQQQGFRTLGAAAVVSRHAFSDLVAAGRPDEEDRREIHEFTDRLMEKLADPEGCPVLTLPDNTEVEPYYVPLQEDGTRANFLKAKPQTDFTKCDHCGICAKACPMGSIDEMMQAAGICIKCQACVRKCPNGAKFFTDEQFLSHVRMLEQNYTRRAENVFLY
ncbi:MAG: 4Fe-4S binding protein [Clostridiales bacterium]|nr:4Fe-4S binding protein [Clostridiales bacterium]